VTVPKSGSTVGFAIFSLVGLAALPAITASSQTLFGRQLDPQTAIDIGIDVAATALANALVASRDAAWAQGTDPIPPHIRKALLAWYPPELLDSIEYRVGVVEEATVQSLAMRFGDANAVTAIDTIIFSDASDAQNNVALWGHEVKHVEQFQRWGLTEFARRYVTDHAAVEAEAYAVGAEIKAIYGGS
jgi:hypothetical protein